MESNKQLSRNGFTIVELLVVIVVIGILAAITIIFYTGISNRATVASLTSDLTNASSQLKLFQVDNSNYPTTIDCSQPDSATNKCLKPSSGTTYNYKSNATSSNVFCLDLTKNSNTYNITQDGQLLAGPCPVLRLDAGNSISYPGTGTTWYDLSGNGNNGTSYNGVTYTNAGGGAMSFDGVGGYIIASGGSSMIASGATQISVAAWVNGLADGVIAHQNGPFFLQISGGKFSSSNEVYTSNGWKSVNGVASISTGVWNYLVMTYDGTNIRNYINGNLDSTTSQTGILGSMPLSCVGIGRGTSGGCNGSTPWNYFKGLIGTVIVYNTALSATEINQNFNALRGRYGI